MDGVSALTTGREEFPEGGALNKNARPNPTTIPSITRFATKKFREYNLFLKDMFDILRYLAQYLQSVSNIIKLHSPMNCTRDKKLEKEMKEYYHLVRTSCPESVMRTVCSK